MMWRTAVLTLVGSSLPTLVPEDTEAQVVVDVGIFWTWGDDGWRSHHPPYAYDGAYFPRRAVPRQSVRYVPVRVPPGHLPPPGSCRLWYPGRPPGHQPPPQPCGSLLGLRGGGGAVIIGGPPAYRDDYRYEQGYRFEDGYGYGSYDARRKGEGRGRGRAEGGGRGRGNGRGY